MAIDRRGNAEKKQSMRKQSNIFKYYLTRFQSTECKTICEPNQKLYQATANYPMWPAPPSLPLPSIRTPFETANFYARRSN